MFALHGPTRPRGRWVLPLLLVSALGLASARPAGATSFTPLGDLPGGSYQSLAWGLSGDGQVVVGASSSAVAGGGLEAFRWTAAGGLQGLGVVPGGTTSTARAASQDGSVIVGEGQATGNQAFRWTAGSGIALLGVPGGYPQSYAYGVSADGTVVAGYGQNFGSPQEAYRWTQSGGFEMLGFLAGGTTSSARAISADGSVITGRADSSIGSEGFVWTAATGMQGLGLRAGDIATSPRAISADGTTIIGTTIASSGSSNGFSWTQAGGLVDLGDFWPSAVSADGSILAGYFSSGTTGAYMWHPALGGFYLKDKLQSQGLDLSAWTLTQIDAISDDGLTVAGHGNGPNGTEAFVATLTIPEPGTGVLFAGAVLAAAAAGRRRRLGTLPPSVPSA